MGHSVQLNFNKKITKNKYIFFFYKSPSSFRLSALKYELEMVKSTAVQPIHSALMSDCLSVCLDSKNTFAGYLV